MGRRFHSEIILFVLIVIFTVVFVSCNPEVKEPSKDVGSLRIDISSSAKTIEPSFGPGRCAKYVMTVKPVGSGGQMTFETTDTSYTVEGLGVGDYEVRAIGCNPYGDEMLASVAKKVSVAKDRTSSVVLDLDGYVPGNGRLSFSIRIPSSYTMVNGAVFYIYDMEDSDFDDPDEYEVTDWTTSEDGRQRVYTLSCELPAGGYGMVASLFMFEPDGRRIYIGSSYADYLNVFNGTESEFTLTWDSGYYDAVSVPVLTVPEGRCEEGTALKIMSPDPRAYVYYTTDGSEPSKNSTLYVNPIAIDRCMTVKAIAVVEGLGQSGVAEASYTVKVQNPTFSIKDRSFVSYDDLVVSTATKGASIYYTIDGSKPSMENGVLYTGPIELYGTVQVRAVAVKDGLEPSDVVSATYYDENSPSSSDLFVVTGQGAISMDRSKVGSLPDVLVLPSFVGGTEVREIAPRGFAGLSNLQGILIPDTIRRIGASAFKGCTGIDSIAIGQYMESIDESAFQGWTAEQSINDYSGLVKANTLKDCKARIYATVKTETQVVSGYTGMANLYGIYMTDNITAIAANAFSGCVNLEDFTMPSYVTDIGSLAFNGCTKVKSMTLPAVLENVAFNAFNGWTDEQSIVDESSIALQAKFSGSSAKVYTRIPARDSDNNPTTVIPADFGKGRDDIYGLEIPDAVTNIGDHAFEGTSIEHLVIPSSVRTMGLELFRNWSDDQKVTVEYGGYTAEVSADGSETPFTGTDAVFEVVMADSVANIGDDAFDGMKTLASIDIPDRIKLIGMRAFKGTSLRSVSMGGSVRSIGEAAFQGCTSLWKVEFGNGLQTIGGNAFMGCSSLVDVKLPDSVQSIGEGVFSYCTALESVDLGGGVTVIPEMAFYNSPSLASITAPNCMGGMDISVIVPLNQLVVHDVKVEVKPTYAATAVGSYCTTVQRGDSSATEYGRMFSYSIPDMLGLTYTVEVTLLDIEGKEVGSRSSQVRVESNKAVKASIAFSLSDIEERSLPAIVIGPDEATVLDGDEISIICDGADAIYYTLDGTVPSPEMGKGVRYEGPFEIHSPVTIKAVAVKEGFSHSRSSATYKVKAIAPTFNPVGVEEGFSIPCNGFVKLSTVEEGTSIYYSLDGGDFFVEYHDEGIALSDCSNLKDSLEIRAYATKDGMNRSDVETKVYEVVHNPDRGNASYVWEKVSDGYECVASSRCHIHGSFVCETERASSTSKVVMKEPTCTEYGTAKYTSVFGSDGYEGQSMESDDVPKAPHEFSDYRCSICGTLAKYPVGGLGPSGGYVFYDCDADNDSGNADGLVSSECGWRYLEAAPADLRVVGGKPTVDATASGYGSAEKGYIFGYYRTSANGSNQLVGTDTAIGTGKSNTNSLVDAMGTSAYTSYSSSDSGTTSDYAARLCSILEYGHDGKVYSDWFLPSKDELNLMYENLRKNGLGSFADSYCWSSSEDNAGAAWEQSFYDGYQYGNNRSGVYRVRPVRAF